MITRRRLIQGGAVLGAAMFARGEGLCAAGDRFAFTCTIGGPSRLGQVFTYKPSPYEGTREERSAPGELELNAAAIVQGGYSAVDFPRRLVAAELRKSRSGRFHV